MSLTLDLQNAVETAGRTVVSVGSPDERTFASGVVWRPGLVVTTHRTLRTSSPRVHLPDGRSVPAEVAGHDPGIDLALLKVEETPEPAVPHGLDGVRVGALVLAVARSPEDGLGAAIGVVSALSGPWTTWRGGRVDRFLQPDLTLYPGFSGGALVDAEGRLLGLNTTGLSRTGARTLPAETVERSLTEILEKGRVSRPYAGLSLHPVLLPRDQGPGLIVLGLEEDGPADRAGFLPGDILLQADGRPLEDVGDLVAHLTGSAVGQTVTLKVLRGGQAEERPLALGDRPR